MAFVSRGFTGEPDLQPISDLLTRCNQLDQLDRSTSVPALRSTFATPGLDPARDLRLWEHGTGKLVGFSQMEMHTNTEAQTDGLLWFWIDPAARHAGLEATILEWGQARLGAVCQARGGTGLFYSGANVDDTWRIATLEQHAMTPIRYFFRMDYALAASLPELPLPPGFTLRTAGGEEEAAAWVELFNQSFIDHWNYHPLTVARVLHFQADPDYRPDLDLLAVAPDGTLAAFCVCEINSEEQVQNGENEGWIAVLGTRRGFRKRGLGRAMLLAGLHRLKAHGVTVAKLMVDAANPSGATRLYESVGFQVARRFVRYVLPM